MFVEEKQLLITNDTNLWKIKNRDNYTKLILNSDINPAKLKGFNNVKELVIDGSYYNERIVRKKFRKKVQFDNVEKIIYKNIKNFCTNNIYAPHLKSIEFLSSIFHLGQYFLGDYEKLEEIIFNVTGTINLGYIYFSQKGIKRIIFKVVEQEYVLESEYEINSINSIKCDSKETEIYVYYSNSYIRTKVTINLINGKIDKENILISNTNCFKEDGCFYIPDCVTNINIEYLMYCREDVSSISLNSKILENQKDKCSLFKSSNLNELKSIILRSNNDMSLFTEKEISLTEYGIVKDLYIENNKMYVCFDNNTLIIDSTGKVYNQDLNLNRKDFILSKYTIKELEEYLTYRRLLEMKKENESNGLDDAINHLEKRLIKKLYK